MEEKKEKKKRNLMTKQQRMDKKVIKSFFSLYPANTWCILSKECLSYQKAISAAYLCSDKRWCYYTKETNAFYTPNGFIMRFCKDTSHKLYDKCVTRKAYAHLSTLECLYVDIDFKENKNVNFSFETFPEQLPVLLKKYHIPEPTMIVCSGHGYHLLWKIESLQIRMGWTDIVRTDLLSEWYGTQAFLYHVFEQLGADIKVSFDPVHFLRYPGTVNAKSGKDPVECKHISYTGKVYSLTSFREQTNAPYMRITQSMADKFGYEKGINHPYDETNCFYFGELIFVSREDYSVKENINLDCKGWISLPDTFSGNDTEPEVQVVMTEDGYDKQDLPNKNNCVIYPIFNSPFSFDSSLPISEKEEKNTKNRQKKNYTNVSVCKEKSEKIDFQDIDTTLLQNCKGANMLFFKNRNESATGVIRLFKARIADITDLLIMRDKINSEGCREVSFFILSYYLCVVLNSPMEAYKTCIELNNKLTYGLHAEELEHAVYSGVGYYTKEIGMLWTNEALANWLHVTPAEQQNMRQIMSCLEVERRRKLRNVRTNQKRQQVRALAKKQEEMFLINRITELLEDGCDVKQICELCDISKATFYRKFNSIHPKQREIIAKKMLQGILLAKQSMSETPKEILKNDCYEVIGEQCLINTATGTYEEFSKDIYETFLPYQQIWIPLKIQIR